MIISRHAPRLGRQCSLVARRAFSSSSSATTPSLSAAVAAIKAHPPRIIPDYLSPPPSHLLSTTIDDLLSPPPPPPSSSSFSSSSSSSSSSSVSSSSPTITSPPTPLPPGHHLVYFPIQLPPSLLVPDGADPRHGPGEPFSRRVWAGGEVVFGKDAGDRLRLDCRGVVCEETVGDVVVRGRRGEGEKVFVDVWRRYGLMGEGCEGGGEGMGEGWWDIEERRTLVFMKKQTAPLPPPRLIKYPHLSSYSTSLTPSSTHLFHFSALSFNAHAIHLDPSYARAVDGHAGLLVHGPFVLALMLRVLTDNLRPLGLVVRAVRYRNHAPLYVNQAMRISVREVVGVEGEEGKGRWDVWVEGPEGGLAVKGTADVVRE